jgi:PAS domain S-box-containing protein
MRTLLKAATLGRVSRLQLQVALIAAVWTTLVAVSMGLSIREHRKSVLQEARMQAQDDLRKGELLRLWASSFDGVYVRTSPGDAPRANLSHSGESRVAGESGAQLTQVSPMTMLRQVEAIADTAHGHRVSLTSLMPLRRENAPDAWEAAALRAFERGEREASAVVTIGGQQVMRVIRPLVADESCAACHREKGLKAGAVRGGISASVPLAPLVAAERGDLALTIIVHASFWLIGLGVIGFGARGVRQQGDDRMRDETALRASEARFRAVTQSANDAIVTSDTAGNIAGWNRGAELIFGYPESEIAGRPVADLMPPAYRDRVAAGIDRLLKHDERRATGRTVVLEGQRKDTTVFPLELSLARWETSEGRFVTGIMRDITERMRVHAELREAKTVAESAVRAKSEFLANMSHEIRTPMNAVIGMTGLLLDTRLDPEQREFVETVRTGGETLLAIINNILDFSKIDSGYLALEAEAFDVRDCVESALDLVAGKAAEKRIDLAYLIGANVPATLVGDVTRLRQVLLNLLSNAVKFTAAGDVFVAVDSRMLDDGRCELHVSVRDSGIGVPADRADRLFRSFSQVDASTTRRYGGTGLGLAISKRLAELMGGSMWFDSVQGKGSTFHCTVVAHVGQGTRRVFLAGVNAALEGRRLLVVDDNATNRRIIGEYARSWGVQVLMAASGAEALEIAARGERLDAALLDMEMAGMDGEMLARGLRDRLGADAPPMLLLTSLCNRVTSAESGFARVLTKPVKPSHLFDALVSVFSGGPVKRASMPRIAAINRDFARRFPMRILLAEDNPVNQLVATRMLERFGYLVDVVANGVEALAAVGNVRYDLLFMDMEMPEMGGVEAAGKIQLLVPEARRPRIVAMTANTTDSDRAACLAAGMDDYIAKPVKVEAIEVALRRAFEAVAARRTSGAPAPSAA